MTLHYVQDVKYITSLDIDKKYQVRSVFIKKKDHKRNSKVTSIPLA